MNCYFICSKINEDRMPPSAKYARIENHLWLVWFPSCMSYLLPRRGFEVLAEAVGVELKLEGEG